MSQALWDRGFSLTTVNSSLSKTNEDGHAGMRLLNGSTGRAKKNSKGAASSIILNSCLSGKKKPCYSDPLRRQRRAAGRPGALFSRDIGKQSSPEFTFALTSGCSAYLRRCLDLFWSRELLVSRKAISRPRCCCSSCLLRSHLMSKVWSRDDDLLEFNNGFHPLPRWCCRSVG